MITFIWILNNSDPDHIFKKNKPSIVESQNY